jgi:hypothetical protein
MYPLNLFTTRRRRAVAHRLIFSMLIVCSSSFAFGRTSPPYNQFDAEAKSFVDPNTKLEWWRRLVRAPGGGGYERESALAACQTGLGGPMAAGWRLGTVQEVLSLVDEEPELLFGKRLAFSLGAFGLSHFPSGDDVKVWTQSLSASGSDGLTVHARTGAVVLTTKNDPNFALCVRELP